MLSAIGGESPKPRMNREDIVAVNARSGNFRPRLIKARIKLPVCHMLVEFA